MDDIHARIPADDNANIVAGCSARCAVGHDHQGNAAPHVLEQAGQLITQRSYGCDESCSGNVRHVILPDTQTRRHAKFMRLYMYTLMCVRASACFRQHSNFMFIAQFFLGKLAAHSWTNKSPIHQNKPDSWDCSEIAEHRRTKSCFMLRPRFLFTTNHRRTFDSQMKLEEPTAGYKQFFYYH
jgi:hypothetical protein